MTIPSSPDDADASQSHFRRIDECCDEFESAWELGKAPRIENFLREAAGGDRPELLRELLRSEWELSVRAGVYPDKTEYLDRFPQDQSVVDRAWAQFSAEDASSAHPPRIPTRVDQFELVEEVGSGAFGVVWKAKDTSLDRWVAIKFPRPGVLDSGSSRRFIREARLAAKLRHPNIVTIHEIGCWEDLTYIVSEYVEGEDLAALQRQRPMNLTAVRALSVKVADALQHAHDAGIIHRDLKPHNILIDRMGEPRITDFGLARQGDGDPILSQEGKMLGTPAYMSPEQVLGRSVDSRADMFSFGVLLYQLLTRKLPFDAPSAPQVFDQVLHTTANPPSGEIQSLDSQWDTIVMRCLRKDPEERFSTMKAVSAALQTIDVEGGEIQRGRGRTTLFALVLLSGIAASIYFLGWDPWRVSEGATEQSVEQTMELQAAVDVLGEVSVVRDGLPVIVKGLGMNLQWVEAGKFSLGQSVSDEEDSYPRVDVEFDYGFWMATHEVTQGQYLAVTGANPSFFNQERLREELGSQGDLWRDYPVDSLTWREAMEYCASLTRLAHEQKVIPLDTLFRLPTEVEWEYVCRSGHESKYLPGGDVSEIESIAWSLEDFSGDPYTQPVGLKEPNPWGFYDMIGNVAEFCLDQYWTYRDSTGRVLTNWVSDDGCGVGFIQRGGYFGEPLERLTATMRNATGPFERGAENGLRLVLSRSHPSLQRALRLEDEKPFTIPRIQLTMNWVRAGRFEIGETSPETPRGPEVYPRTGVTIGSGFWIAETEVTERQYEMVTGLLEGRPSELSFSSSEVGYDLPKVNVNWMEAVAFCEMVTSALREGDLLPEGMVVRLPTEAEWEWACRRCFESVYHFGGSAGPSFRRRARFLANSDGVRGIVMGKSASIGGLHGMYGNVKEWCLDWKYKYTVIDSADPIGLDAAAGAGLKSLRGGDYLSPAARCTGTVRNFELPSEKSAQIGFRVVLAPPIGNEKWTLIEPDPN